MNRFRSLDGRPFIQNPMKDSEEKLRKNGAEKTEVLDVWVVNGVKISRHRNISELLHELRNFDIGVYSVGYRVY